MFQVGANDSIIFTDVASQHTLKVLSAFGMQVEFDDTSIVKLFETLDSGREGTVSMDQFMEYFSPTEGAGDVVNIPSETMVSFVCSRHCERDDSLLTQTILPRFGLYAFLRTVHE